MPKEDKADSMKLTLVVEVAQDELEAQMCYCYCLFTVCKLSQYLPLSLSLYGTGLDGRAPKESLLSYLENDSPTDPLSLKSSLSPFLLGLLLADMLFKLLLSLLGLVFVCVSRKSSSS